MGVHVSCVNQSLHVASRNKACRNSFYSMQCIGMCDRGCSSDTIYYVWNTVIRPILTWGIQCITINKTSLQELETIQTKLLKVALGIYTFCRNSPILNAMKVHKLETTLDVSYLEFVRNVLKSNSRARSFYIHLLNMHICDKLFSQNKLIRRASRACDKYDISFIVSPRRGSET